MKASQIKPLGVYTAKVSGNLTQVQVNAIRTRRSDGRTVYDVTNLTTGRKTTFESAAKFRSEASAEVVTSIKPKPKVNTTQFGSPQTGFPEDGGTVGGPTFLPEFKPTKKGKADVTLVNGPTGVAGGDSQTGSEHRNTPATTTDVSQPTSTDSSKHDAGEVNTTPVPVQQSHLSGLAARIKPATASHPHLVVKAYAGTGKTFTQIVGVAWAFGQSLWPQIVRRIAENINLKAGYQKVDPETFQIVPSPEQAKVWEQLAFSRGSVRTVTYCAFNKSIVTEFGQEWGWLVKMLDSIGIILQFATVNSLGAKVCNTAYGRLECVDWHTENLVGKYLHKDPREIKRNASDAVMLKAVCDLVGLCKLTLTEPDQEGLEALCSHFEIELNGQQSKVFSLVPIILEISRDPSTNKLMDWNDQNWLPVVNGLPIPQVDILLVDESQDLPRCKQEFVRKMGRRIVLVGDIHQAIYGFAGADVDSIPRMTQMLAATEQGCNVLHLTETRRCGKAIVAKAKEIVPDFTAHESNCEGSISRLPLTKLVESAQDKDMVLCRVNGPLVSQALRMIKAGKKAIIRGRDFGKSLITFVQKQEARDVVELIEKVSNWAASEAAKENAKKNPSDAKLLSIQDRYECIQAFSEGSTTVFDVIGKMELVFAGKVCRKCGKHYVETQEQCYPCQQPLVKPDGVLFSSIHKAKGLEANRVFMLDLKGLTIPHPMCKSEWSKVQDWNCRYIEITRAIEELIYVYEE